MVKLSQEMIISFKIIRIQLRLQCPGVCSGQCPKSLTHMKQGTSEKLLGLSIHFRTTKVTQVLQPG